MRYDVQYELIELLSSDHDVRSAALAQLKPVSEAALFAIRRVLLLDPDAKVRAQAASRMALASPHLQDQAARCLEDALADAMPSVREAAARACGHLGQQRSSTALTALALQDIAWRVRRAALLALAICGASSSIKTLRAALSDPFWRVRQAALHALSALGEERPEDQQHIAAQDAEMKPVAAAALWYLRTRFAQVVDVHKFRPVPRENEALWNADPAVITARLRKLPPTELNWSELVPMLADPHQPLRILAAERLLAHAPATILYQAADLLEAPGMPHTVDTVWALYDAAGNRSKELAGLILSAQSSGAGALLWACRFVQQSGVEALLDAVYAHRQHPDPRIRAQVLRTLQIDSAARLPLRQLAEAALYDPQECVRDAAAFTLTTAGDAAAMAQVFAQPLSQFSLHARCALVELAAKQEQHSVLHHATHDPHPLPRSAALSALAIRGLLVSPGDYLADADPLIRAAVLPAVSAKWQQLLCADLDPAVRREVVRLACKHDSDLDVALRSQLAVSASESADPAVRALSCRLLKLSAPSELRVLLALWRDTVPAVRTAAADALEAVAQQAEAEAARLLGESGMLSETERSAAYCFLLRNLHSATEQAPAAAALLIQTLNGGQESAQVQAQLITLAMLLPPAVQAQLRPELQAHIDTQLAQLASPPVRPQARPKSHAVQAQAQPTYRALGRTQIQVSALGLSGAQGLQEAAFRTAHARGVNLFFWEPRYASLTRFLRNLDNRSSAVIVAGSYEADKEGIERDVALALRRLQTDYLDVFLLFWVRSEERLSEEAQQCLQSLKDQGVIRAFGFSTHERELACKAIATGHWDVLMTRHSAAHPGAETQLLPVAKAHGVGVLSFSALCYSRLLRAVSGAPPESPVPVSELPTAAECYRYSLSQEGVSACWSAPRYFAELDENLAVLDGLPLSAARQQVLRQHGQSVRSEGKRFDALVRKGHEGNQEGPAPQKLSELLQLLMESADGGDDQEEGVPPNLGRPRKRPQPARTVSKTSAQRTESLD